MTAERDTQFGAETGFTSTTSDELAALRERFESFNFAGTPESFIEAAAMPEALEVNWSNQGPLLRLKVQTQEDKARTRVQDFMTPKELRSSYVYVRLDEYLMKLADIASNKFRNGRDTSLLGVMDIPLGRRVKLTLPKGVLTMETVRQACCDLLLADAASSPEPDELIFKTILRGVNEDGKKKFDERLTERISYDLQKSLRTRLYRFAYNNRLVPNKPNYDGIIEDRIKRMGKPNLSQFIEDYVDTIQASHRSVEDLVNLLIFSSLGLTPSEIDTQRREGKITLDSDSKLAPTLTIDYLANKTFATRLSQFSEEDRDIYIDSLVGEELRIRGVEKAKHIRLAARVDYTLSELRAAVERFCEGEQVFRHSNASNTVAFGGGYVKNLTIEVPYGTKAKHTEVDIVSGQLSKVSVTDLRDGHIHLAKVSGVIQVENCTGDIHILSGSGNVFITSADHVRISSRKAEVVHAGKATELRILRSNIDKLTVYNCAGGVEESTVGDESKIIDSPDFNIDSLDEAARQKVEVVI